MEPIDVVIVATPFVAVMSLSVFSAVRAVRQRRRAATGAREFAERHSWRYMEESPGLTERFELPLTASGRLRHPRSRNHIHGTYRGRAARSWDFSSTQKARRGRSGGGRHAKADLYHLVALKSDQDLPSLTMTARGGAFSRAFAEMPSQTTGDAAFDRAWQGTAQDQSELRALLDDGFRARLLGWHGELAGLATRGRTLVVWRQGRQQPEKIEPLLEKAAELARQLER